MRPIRQHVQPLTRTPALWPLPVTEVNHQTRSDPISQLHDLKRLIVDPFFSPDRPTNSCMEILHRAALWGSLSNVSICTTIILRALEVTPYKGSVAATWNIWTLYAVDFLIIKPGMNCPPNWLCPSLGSLDALVDFFKTEFDMNEWIWKLNYKMLICEHLFNYTLATYRYLIFWKHEFGNVNEHWSKHFGFQVDSFKTNTMRCVCVFYLSKIFQRYELSDV